MPGLNQTGPMGQGPMTGRRMGRCTNYGANQGRKSNPRKTRNLTFFKEEAQDLDEDKEVVVVAEVLECKTVPGVDFRRLIYTIN